MPKLMPSSIQLTAPEAACLNALRAGKERKTPLAREAGLTIKRTEAALVVLREQHLVTTVRGRVWSVTPLGRDADIEIKPIVRSRGRPINTAATPGPSALRLLALLDRPRSGAELGLELGVTRQRIHQIITDLIALDRIRVADPTFPTFMIARKDDPTLLLRPDQVRVLSVFPEFTATTLSRVAAAVQMPIAKVTGIGRSLMEAGLIETAGATTTYGDLYRQTPAGAAHWQRSTTERQAELPSLQFRSDRVRTVFACLHRDGPIRTRDVGLALEIPQPVINGLMQNLKRKGMVRTVSDARHAPYILTPAGVDMLAAMDRLAAGDVAIG